MSAVNFARAFWIISSEYILNRIEDSTPFSFYFFLHYCFMLIVKRCDDSQISYILFLFQVVWLGSCVWACQWLFCSPRNIRLGGSYPCMCTLIANNASLAPSTFLKLCSTLRFMLITNTLSTLLIRVIVLWSSISFIISIDFWTRPVALLSFLCFVASYTFSLCLFISHCFLLLSVIVLSFRFKKLLYIFLTSLYSFPDIWSHFSIPV